MGTNYFSNLRENVLNIEFKESLIAEKKFRGSDDVVNFYDIYDIAFFFRLTLSYYDEFTFTKLCCFLVFMYEDICQFL